MTLIIYSLLFFGCGTTATYIKPPFPEPTDPFQYVGGLLQGWTPKPTPPPDAQLGRYQNLSGPQNKPCLRARGDDASQIGWIVKDNTCGYAGGTLELLLKCPTTDACAGTLVNGYGFMGCCGTIGEPGCIFISTCIDRDQFYVSSQCDEVCQARPGSLKCTASDRPYCLQYTIPGINVHYYGCVSTSTNQVRQLLTTFDGEDDGRSWTAVFASETSLLPTPGSSVRNPRKKSHTGVIVAGVLAGTFVIGVAVGLLVYRSRKSKRTQRELAPVAMNHLASPHPQSSATHGPERMPYEIILQHDESQKRPGGLSIHSDQQSYDTAGSPTHNIITAHSKLGPDFAVTMQDAEQPRAELPDARSASPVELTDARSASPAELVGDRPVFYTPQKRAGSWKAQR